MSGRRFGGGQQPLRKWRDHGEEEEQEQFIHSIRHNGSTVGIVQEDDLMSVQGDDQLGEPRYGREEGGDTMTTITTITSTTRLISADPDPADQQSDVIGENDQQQPQQPPPAVRPRSSRPGSIAFPDNKQPRDSVDSTAQKLTSPAVEDAILGQIRGRNKVAGLIARFNTGSVSVGDENGKKKPSMVMATPGAQNIHEIRRKFNQ